MQGPVSHLPTCLEATLAFEAGGILADTSPSIDPRIASWACYLSWGTLYCNAPGVQEKIGGTQQESSTERNLPRRKASRNKTNKRWSKQVVNYWVQKKSCNRKAQEGKVTKSKERKTTQQNQWNTKFKKEHTRASKIWKDPKRGDSCHAMHRMSISDIWHYSNNRTETRNLRMAVIEALASSQMDNSISQIHNTWVDPEIYWQQLAGKHFQANLSASDWWRQRKVFAAMQYLDHCSPFNGVPNYCGLVAWTTASKIKGF